MDQADIERIAQSAAEAAVHQIFRLFGVDTEDQDSVNAFRADLVHARKMRRIWDGAAGRITLGIVIAIVVAGVVWASDWIKIVLGFKG